MSSATVWYKPSRGEAYSVPHGGLGIIPRQYESGPIGYPQGYRVEGARENPNEWDVVIPWESARSDDKGVELDAKREAHDRFAASRER